MYDFGGYSYSEVSSSFVDDLKRVVKDSTRVKQDEESLEDVSRDRSFHPPRRPAVVVLPISTQEVADVIRACHSARVPVTVRGAGTGLEGGCIPYCGGLVLDTSALKSKRLGPQQDMIAHVGAGVLKNELNNWLKPYGLLFGPDPSSNPSVGGMVSTGGSGLSTLRYGTSQENVVSLTVVTPQGEIVHTRQNVRKASTGYELTQIYMGSEGTLGVITEICVKLHPLPTVRCGGIARFQHVSSAARAVVVMIRSELSSATNSAFESNYKCTPTLFIEFQSNAMKRNRDDAKRAQQIVSAIQNEEKESGKGFSASIQVDEGKQKLEVDGDIDTAEWAYTEDQDSLDEMWSARRGCYYASCLHRRPSLLRPSPAERGGTTQEKLKRLETATTVSQTATASPDEVFISDVCVPVSNLADCVAETENDFQSAGMECLICAHIGDGNFHCLIPYQPQEKDTVKKVEENMIRRAVRYGGVVSGEHGVGVGKMHLVPFEHSAAHMRVQRSIKAALDPFNLLNPQKMLRMRPHALSNVNTATDNNESNEHPLFPHSKL